MVQDCRICGNGNAAMCYDCIKLEREEIEFLRARIAALEAAGDAMAAEYKWIERPGIHSRQMIAAVDAWRKLRGAPQPQEDEGDGPSE